MVKPRSVQLRPEKFGMSRSVNLPVDHSALCQSAALARIHSSDTLAADVGSVATPSWRIACPYISVFLRGELTWVLHEFVRVSVLLRSVVVRVLVLVVMVVRVRRRRGDSAESRRRDELGSRSHLLWD